MIKIKLVAQMCMAAWLFAAAALMWGCSSDKPAAPPPAPPPPPVASLSQIKAELLDAKAQIQSTSDALDKLGKSTATDAQGNYNKFTEEFIKLQAKSESVKSRAKDLKDKTAAYYATWNRQGEVQNPELRRQAVQQKADAERVYSSIGSEMELARISFDPFMTNLKDVGNYLRGNLSPANIASVSDLVTKATGQAKEVNTHIDAIIGSIDKMAAATGEGSAPPPVK